ncbi:uncharacterized protein ACA1_131590 [Acanthamoeba castellanii str. Neff]|uniref:Uncharacterized protein n=1 Tax=Acanthamoeba castellanii (strain ATCC 30010 / Neff) TaxID=1257118 RepID=L8GPY0_ACACF|nr:uncharacterized protein ACA1_131590 [Acanthamoeba castellanii str. Neff]ELR14166.1 hypothetical protein ACA1_131590 [Acanthamoeba castellanii str. Neff]
MPKGQPLLPGNSTMHQLELISVLMNPSVDDVTAIESPYAKQSMSNALGWRTYTHGWCMVCLVM